MNTTKKQFKAICKLESELNVLSNNDTLKGDDVYYTKREVLQKELKAFIRTDFRVLNAKELLKLCTLVSKFRPVEPFSFLVTCSLLINKPL